MRLDGEARTLRPLVTVAVVPREKFSRSPRSLRSLLANTGCAFELVYIDGASPPRIRDQVDALLAGVPHELIRVDRYLGPFEAMSMALESAKTPYLVLADNDIHFREGWLDALVACAREQGADVVSPLVLIGDEHSHTIHVAGGLSHVEEANGVRRIRHNQHYEHVDRRDAALTLRRERTELVESHCFLARTETLVALGRLDPTIGHAVNVDELSIGLARVGAHVWFEPKAEVVYLFEKGMRLDRQDVALLNYVWSEEWIDRDLMAQARRHRLDRPSRERRRQIRWWLGDHRRVWLWPIESGAARVGLRSGRPNAWTLWKPLEVLEVGANRLAREAVGSVRFAMAARRRRFGNPGKGSRVLTGHYIRAPGGGAMNESPESGLRSECATVVICTKDRGDQIVDTVTSVLASGRQDFELLIIDQSESDVTQLALLPFLDDARIRYIRTHDVGVARSRSLALHEANNEFVLNTDDDCVVDPSWIDENLRALNDNPRAAIVFGDVIAPPDPSNGYAPESVADTDFTVHSIWSWKTTDGANVGIGASMGMRRSVLLDLGGFDHQLGPGTRFRNSEDTDMTLRTVLGGHEVVRVTGARVAHYGHRSHEDFRELTRASMFGFGAVCGKLIRRRPAAALWFGLGVAWRMVLIPAVSSLVRLRKPPVLGRSIYLAKGFWVGVRLPLDHANHMLFASIPI